MLLATEVARTTHAPRPCLAASLWRTLSQLEALGVGYFFDSTMILAYFCSRTTRPPRNPPFSCHVSQGVYRAYLSQTQVGTAQERDERTSAAAAAPQSQPARPSEAHFFVARTVLQGCSASVCFLSGFKGRLPAIDSTQIESKQNIQACALCDSFQPSRAARRLSPKGLVDPGLLHLSHNDFQHHGSKCPEKMSPHWGLNPGPSVYKTDALPLSYRGSA